MHMFNKDNTEKSTFHGHDIRKRQREMFSNTSLMPLKRRHLSIFSWDWVHSCLKWPNEMELETDAFTKMDNLKLLRLNYVQFNGCYASFPGHLRWLCWHGFPLKILPGDLCLRSLVSLDLSYSNLERVWERTKV